MLLKAKLLGLRGQTDLAALAEYNALEAQLSQLESSGIPIEDDCFFSSISPRISQQQNETLLLPFEADEVKSATFSMFPNESPGPDGMNPGFFQHFWDVVGHDVSSFVLDCLHSGAFPVGLNETNVVLIPKKNQPEMVSDIRPIALCNVVYKVIAKMIANRMKPLLDGVILESQSAFIPDRLITDNIPIAAEVGHYLNMKQCGRVGWGALKLDMVKAYDKMEWSFLRGSMKKWVDLIMLCVTTVSYNIPVNGARGGKEANVVKQCLQTYEHLSGQTVNFHKSNICFSKNTGEGDMEDVVNLLNVNRALNFGKYLGLPSFVGRNEKLVFAYIEKRIKQRIGSWNKKLLSQAAIERAMNRFWWNKGGTNGSGSIHWMAWDRLSKPKSVGGLGFKDLKAFNLAMLGKQAWRFLRKLESLAARVYKARYFPKTSFADATLGNNPSYCWRSIMVAHDLVSSGVRRRIGNGESTLIWGHPWLLDNYDPMVGTAMPPYLEGSKVSSLIDTESNSWDLAILRDIFSPNDVNRKAMNVAVWDACLQKPKHVWRSAAAAISVWEGATVRRPSSLPQQRQVRPTPPQQQQP
ncbi:PREDICTED: uncharacterized protein LOC109147820 [Ipomoea nil]|uniref:uncharacterized protein LOC109147820 n=1 Tax=Ipomoea nil TaxID=35883 RepID=UPI0009009AAC|nr:PREDICTED: uncharacterized protein LOC109147820 [Ipomoea nil]